LIATKAELTRVLDDKMELLREVTAERDRLQHDWNAERNGHRSISVEKDEQSRQLIALRSSLTIAERDLDRLATEKQRTEDNARYHTIHHRARSSSIIYRPTSLLYMLYILTLHTYL
jgi:hypothetical protein